MSHLPNALTVGRIVVVPIFVAVLFLPGGFARWTAFALFCLAGISDVLDGAMARKLGATTPFGRMLDPIADKLIVSAALLMLAADGTISGLSLIPALVILCREILVSGLREFLAQADVSVPVTRIAKFKTALQMIAVGALIMGPAGEAFVTGSVWIAHALLWIAGTLTLYTGYAYLQVGLAHARAPKGRETP